MRLPLALVLCCTLLAALTAGWTVAHADEPNDAESPPTPLEVTFYADASVCTAGSMMQVHWEISGGAEPYQATLNGEPVDASSNSAPVPCGPAYDIPAWLRGIVQPPPLNIDLTILDAAGSEAAHALTLNRAPPLPAPTVDAGPIPGWTYRTLITAHAHGVGVNQVRRYLIRWRAQGSTVWNYHTDTALPGSSGPDYLLYHETEMIGARVAVEVAQVRSLAESATLNLLNWSETAYATTASPPTDLTTRATHDTITVSWGPVVEGLAWKASVSPVGRRDRDYDRRHGAWDRSEWTQKAVGPVLPYEVSHDGLLPDTLYSVRVALDDNCDSYGWDDELCASTQRLSVRTAPAPPGWSREPRRPQNVRATAHPGGVGFVVAWDPPLEGEERAYEVIAHEYGTPRPDPITPVGGVGGPSYVVRLPRDTTYEVFVRHLGIEDEETRVIVEPRSTESESIDEYMTLPDWHVEHRYPDYGERSRGYKFVVTWDTEHRGKIVQVRWLRDGHAMTQSAEQPPIVIWTADPGPHPFQLRLRRGELGPWSRWSSALRVSAKPPPPESLYVREQQGVLIASWPLPPTSPPGYFSDAHDLLRDLIDGFRVYLHRTGEQVRMLDVGMATSAEFPIPADGGEYEIQVASYSDSLGEGRAISQTFSQSVGPTLYMSSTYDDPVHHDMLTCDRVGGVPALVSWRIQGGAAPYTIQVDGGPATVTSDHEGLLEVHCETGDMQREIRTEVRAVVTVTDARGRTDRDGIRYTILDLRDDDGEPISLAESWHRLWPSLALSRFYVQSDSLLLRWNRWNGNVMWQQDRHLRSFVVRWRETGAQAWHYRAADGAEAINCGGSSSKWTLDELAPNTEYEVQIATYFGADDLTQPNQLDWTESHIARTLPDAIHPTLQRRDSDIIVSWPSIAEATDYAVALRADGISWWKVYEPQGNDLEQAVFVDVPTDLDAGLRAEIEITAAISADQGGPIIEDYAYCD